MYTAPLSRTSALVSWISFSLIIIARISFSLKDHTVQQVEEECFQYILQLSKTHSQQNQGPSGRWKRRLPTLNIIMPPKSAFELKLRADHLVRFSSIQSTLFRTNSSLAPWWWRNNFGSSTWRLACSMIFPSAEGFPLGGSPEHIFDKKQKPLIFLTYYCCIRCVLHSTINPN